MKSKINSIIIAAIAFSFLFACGKKEETQSPAETTAFNFKVQMVLGDVKIKTASGQKAASMGDIVAVSDTIVTGKKSIADLTYGASGVIRIKENSSVTVSVIAGAGTSDTMMNMEKGKIYLTLGKLQNTGFKIKTPTVVASVRGTSFTVATTPKGAVLAVMRGSVRLNPVKEGEIVEDKSIVVETGHKTGYVDQKSVDSIVQGKKEIDVTAMTHVEIEEIKKDALDMKVDTIKEIDSEVREEVRRDVIEVDPKTLRSSDTGDPAKEQDELKRKQEEQRLAEAKRKNDEELKRQEELRKQEELKRQEELKKQEEEKARQKKKEKGTSIPTL